jgi:hypothetical protein
MIANEPRQWITFREHNIVASRSSAAVTSFSIGLTETLTETTSNYVL